jgi:hypothetical protein
MRKTMRILGVSVRGQGAVATYGGRSPEFVQKTVAVQSSTLPKLWVMRRQTESVKRCTEVH